MVPHEATLRSDGSAVVVKVRCRGGCAEIKTVAVPHKGYMAWMLGDAHIQTAMPDVPREERELLISGTCDACFKRLFGPYDDSPDPLTVDQMGERADILWNVDERACQGCGRAYTTDQVGDLSADASWFVDSYLVPNESLPEEPVRLATILCPECW